MITGFKKVTHDLTKAELSIVNKVTRYLVEYASKEKVTSGFIINILSDKDGVTISGPRFRKIVNYIRLNFLLPGLIATSEGYYISKKPNEIKSYIESLEHRENAIKQVRRSMQKYYQTLA